MPNEQELRQAICWAGGRLYEQGFAAANDGNISVRLDNGNMLTTPTGVSKGELTPEMLVVVDASGKLLAGERKPSTELKLHLRVYARRPDVQAVVHAHPPYATSFAVVGRPLKEPLIAEAIVHVGPVALAPYATPGTEEVPDSIEPFVLTHNAILLANHGALTYGPDLTSAQFRMESLEFYAKITALSQQIGTPRPLAPAQVECLKCPS
ncbi:MAG TPA: class II aldolase family protein [Firmicutes bacterium]|jgi:L-fuculose-phosphate aldolase|nr:class II aldolase family protein [Bacillota bacterium]